MYLLFNTISIPNAPCQSSEKASSNPSLIQLVAFSPFKLGWTPALLLRADFFFSRHLLLAPPPPTPYTQERGCRPFSRPCRRVAALKAAASCPLPSGWWAQSWQSWGRPLGKSSTSTRGSSVLSTPPSSGSWCTRRETPRLGTTHGRPGVTSRHQPSASHLTSAAAAV